MCRSRVRCGPGPAFVRVVRHNRRGPVCCRRRYEFVWDRARLRRFRGLDIGLLVCSVALFPTRAVVIAAGLRARRLDCRNGVGRRRFVRRRCVRLALFRNRRDGIGELWRRYGQRRRKSQINYGFLPGYGPGAGAADSHLNAWVSRQFRLRVSRGAGRRLVRWTVFLATYFLHWREHSRCRGRRKRRRSRWSGHWRLIVHLLRLLLRSLYLLHERPSGGLRATGSRKD